MGYDTRIYIVDKGSKKDDGSCFGEVIAAYELGKVYDISDITSSYPATDAYIYGVDCDDKILTDCYGDPLKEIPIPEMINIVARAIAADLEYRRLNPLLQLLKGFDLNQWNNLVALHYGH